MNYYKHYQKCIEACLACATACQTCASASLNEPNVKMMTRCIRLDLECEAICITTANILTIGGITHPKICLLCIDICKACAEECAKHEHEHCQICAEACERCAMECSKILA